jgi:hypothetical protein
MNPGAPNPHATIKLHKQDMLIRPIIIWRNTPAYKLAEHLTHMLCNYLPLPYVYNICNSVHLIIDLENMGINENMQICLLDIMNMYTNIPKLDKIIIIIYILNINSEIDGNKQKKKYIL